MNLTSLTFFVPNASIEFISQWIKNYHLKINIRNPRKTKLGDYRFNPLYNSHEISVNNNLSKEAFFFVLTHEIAHLHTRVIYGNKVKSHGAEWKSVFRKLLLESIEIYQPEIRKHIQRHAINPKASVGADPNLHKVLFNELKPEGQSVQSLEINQIFRIGKRIFQKGEKRKIRYLCKEIRTGKLYTVSGSAVVDEIFEK